MIDWQPIETAPTGTPVMLGGWGPDWSRMHSRTGPEKLQWNEGIGIAYALNERAIRVRKCDIYARWWKPINLAPPAPQASETGDAA